MDEIIPRIVAFVVPLLPGLAIGYLLGRFARNALGTALMVAAGIAVAVFVLGYFGADVSFVREWLEAGSSWAGEQMSEAKQLLASIVPPIAALGIGFKIGMGKG